MTYSEIEKVLARLYSVEAQVRTTFLARIRYFQRLGFPMAGPVGRGNRINYTIAHLYTFVMAFELGELGLRPSAIQQFMEEAWLNGELIDVVEELHEAAAAKAVHSEDALLVIFERKSTWFADNDASAENAAHTITSSGHLQMAIETASPLRRFQVLNLSRMTRSVNDCLAALGVVAPPPISQWPYRRGDRQRGD